MKKGLMFGLAILLTVLLCALFPTSQREEAQTEKGAYVLRIWAAEGQGDINAWLKQAAALYEKNHAHRVYIRTASKEEMQQAMTGENIPSPDVLILPGEGVPLAFRGYGLVLLQEGEAKETLPPKPLLFIRPTLPPPKQTPTPAPFPENLTVIAVPASMQGKLNGGMVSQNPLKALLQGDAMAAVLTFPQIQQIKTGYVFYPRGDLFEPLGGRALTKEGEEMLSFLRGEGAQGLLTKQYLFSWDEKMRLYPPEMELLYAMESSR